MARVRLSLDDDQALPAKLFDIWLLFGQGMREVTLVIPDECVELGKYFEKDDLDFNALKESNHGDN